MHRTKSFCWHELNSRAILRCFEEKASEIVREPWIMSHNLPLPPFGQYLLSQIINNDQYAAIIFMGNHAESRAIAFQDHLPFTCYLPTGTNPKRYKWPVKGCHVYLIDTSYSSANFVKTCVLCLLEYGATQVDYFSPKSHQIFKRELKNV